MAGIFRNIIAPLASTAGDVVLGAKKDRDDALAREMESKKAQRQSVLDALMARKTESEISENVANAGALGRRPITPEDVVVTVGEGGKRVYTPKSQAPGMAAPEPPAPSTYSFPVGANAEGQPIVLRANNRTGEVAPTPQAAKQDASSGRGSASLTSKIATNKANLSTIDDALAELDKYPDAVGLTRGIPVIGDRLDPRLDPEGVAARASIANIGSLVIHTRSGAAVSVHEFPRLAPFIPAINDPPDAIRTKLAKLKRGIEVETQALEAGAARPSVGGEQPTREQALWDAAVAKHGEAVVLEKFGPRP